jgi:hypothetical protein
MDIQQAEIGNKDNFCGLTSIRIIDAEYFFSELRQLFSGCQPKTVQERFLSITFMSRGNSRRGSKFEQETLFLWRKPKVKNT